MNLAITLLVALAFASVIGTALKQNEPYQNYLVKFGPFWHGVFEQLGLYDIYSSGWFILTLAFLVTSTGICLYRNTPRVLSSLRQYQENVQESQLLNLANHYRYQTPLPHEEVVNKLAAYFHQIGFRTRIKRREGEEKTTLAAMKGAGNRLGYLFTHSAIVIICVGGFLDSNVPLKIRVLKGTLQAETREIPISQIPRQSKLPIHNRSFRASVSIPEGRAVKAAFINVGAGYLVQPLPFSILVKNFRVAHYPSGQPKSFESDLVIRENDLSIEKTIAVNHPLKYRGYTIYQASFGDGGSKLALKLHDLSSSSTPPREYSATVGQTLALRYDDRPYTLELDEFRKFNIFANEDPTLDKTFRDFGPSVTVKIRQADGSAREYLNYMYPVSLEGREFLLSGMRSSISEEFKYLHIPVDDAGSATRFLEFLSLLNDNEKLVRIFIDNQEALFTDAATVGRIPERELGNVILRLTRLFLDGGFPSLQQHLDIEPDTASTRSLNEASMKLLRFGLQQAYLAVLANEGISVENLSERDIQFLNDAIVALSALHEYGAPFYLQLADFKHIEATGLQITRSPGTKWVYFGFSLLITGVFLLFYVPHQRLWAIISTGARTELLIAGARTRHSHDFNRYFAQISRTIAQSIPGESRNR